MGAKIDKPERLDEFLQSKRDKSEDFKKTSGLIPSFSKEGYSPYKKMIRIVIPIPKKAIVKKAF